MPEAPDAIRRLAEERARRRAEGDYAAADELRTRISEGGYRVHDHPDGSYELSPDRPARTHRVPAGSVPSALEDPPTADWSIHWLHEGWAEDVARGTSSFRRWSGGRRLHQVVVESVPAEADTWPDDVEVLPLDRDPGFGAARNAGLRRSRGRLLAVVDGSVEATGDVLGPLEAALADPAVGVAGPVTTTTEDLREFREARGPDVDVVEAYLMAFRREILEAGVAFDRHYRFYRAADVDVCFQVKARGLRVVRVDVPIRRHEHRAWAALAPDRREALSKRNFYRFLERFGGRTDLLARGSPRS